MIILLGGTGMMGRRIAHQLIQNKYDVWQPSRQWMLDFQNKEHLDTLHQELLQKVSKDTILINTIGMAPGFGNQPHENAYATQKAMIDFCLQQDINKVITLSALSHYPNPEDIPYLHYKYRLDNELLDSAAISYIVRPSLIYDTDGASTRFFKRLTKSPVLAFPKQPNYAVSPIDADELAKFILKLISCDLPSQIFEVGTEVMTIRNYLKQFNPKLIILPLPEWIMNISMQFLGIFMPAIAGQYAYQLLKAGSTHQRDDFLKIMGYSATFPNINTIEHITTNETSGNNHHDE